MKCIVLATDGSPVAERAGAFAAELAAATGAELHVVSVTVPTRLATSGGSIAVAGAFPDRPVEAIPSERDLAATREVLHRAREAAALAGRDAVAHAAVGHPADEIERIAAEVAADVIVVGSHGHGVRATLRTVFAGSVKRDLVDGEGNIPVVVVRDGRDARRRRELARGIEQVLHEAEEDARWRPFPLRSIIPYQVAVAVAPALMRVHDALADPERDIDAGTIAQISAFLTEGATSPLYRTDVEAAARVARELADAVSADAGV